MSGCDCNIEQDSGNSVIEDEPDFSLIDLLDPVANTIDDLRTVAELLLQYELENRHRHYLIECVEKHVKALDHHFQLAWDGVLK